MGRGVTDVADDRQPRDAAERRHRETAAARRRARGWLCVRPIPPELQKRRVLDST